MDLSKAISILAWMIPRGIPKAQIKPENTLIMVQSMKSKIWATRKHFLTSKIPPNIKGIKVCMLQTIIICQLLPQKQLRFLSINRILWYGVLWNDKQFGNAFYII